MKTTITSRLARTVRFFIPTALLLGLALLVMAGTTDSVKTYAVSPVATKARVTVFLSTQCPVSKVYSPRLNALELQFKSQGVQFSGVFSNMQESQSEIGLFKQSRHLNFTCIKDADGHLAAKYGATMTPQAFVEDPSGKLIYQGRIDDNVDTSQVHKRDLEAALNAVLAGRAVAHSKTVAFGCIIRRPAAVVASSQITYSHDVAPILQRQCVTCHRAGEIGPMALNSYAQAAAWRGDIKRYTQSRQMPPWKADPGAGDFQDTRRLTGKELATLTRWVDSGAPEGNPKDLPLPVHYTQGWPLGKPDMVLQPDRPYHVEADGADVYRCYVIPTDFEHDRYVSAVDVEPGNRTVVHHVIAFIDGSGASAALDKHEKEPGYTSFGGVGFTPTGMLAGWAPGITAHYLPQGIATQVPAGARIVLQVHYHKDGKPETDLSRIGLYFAKGPTDKTIHVIPMIHSLEIPAGDTHYSVTTVSVPSPVDTHLIAITPHMHWLGRQIKAVATLPGGEKIPLISISDWDFNWQNTYFYKRPIALPKGTIITMTATYDNSARNLRNPNSPPKTVTWGEATTDEMCLAFLHYTLDREHLGSENKVNSTAKNTSAPHQTLRRSDAVPNRSVHPPAHDS